MLAAMKWQQLKSDPFTVFRSAVPGGWMVVAYISGVNTPSLTFYPDADHRWDGASLPLSR